MAAASPVPDLDAVRRLIDRQLVAADVPEGIVEIEEVALDEGWDGDPVTRISLGLRNGIDPSSQASRAVGRMMRGVRDAVVDMDLAPHPMFRTRSIS